jgi:hypothetical protein
MFMFGSWFDTDVQYPWAAEALWDDSLPDEMARAEALHMGMLAYLGSVFGPGRMFARKALRPLRAALLEPAPEDRDALRRQLPQVLERVYPGKCRWLGEARLNAVIDGAWKVAAVYSIDSPRALRLLTMFAFMLGHRFHEDPLYPWIAGPLEAGRADRLETSAILYLDGVLKEVEG